jgi:hypothetical protein
MPGLDADDRTPALNPVYHTDMSGGPNTRLMRSSAGDGGVDKRSRLSWRLRNFVLTAFSRRASRVALARPSMYSSSRPRRAASQEVRGRWRSVRFFADSHPCSYSKGATVQTICCHNKSSKLPRPRLGRTLLCMAATRGCSTMGTILTRWC